MSAPGFFAERCAKRAQRGQCLRCEDYLPEGWARRTCAACLRYVAENTRDRYYASRGLSTPGKRAYEARKASGACPRCGTAPPTRGFETCDKCRAEIKVRNEINRGKREDPAPERKVPENTSTKWAALEDEMARPCERCGLRGPHECLPSIYELASSHRHGPGRAMPEGGPSGLRVGSKR